MTNETEAPPSPSTARELFEGVDALMRRNRRTGAVTAPLPPPEGHVAVPEDETPALPVEIGVEPEAEFAQVTQQVESDTLEALLSAPEPSEPLPEVVSEAVAAEEVEEEAEEQAVEQRTEMIPSMPVLMEDDLLFWEFAPRSQADEIARPVATEAEEANEVPLALTPSFSDAISFLSAPEVLASPSQVSALYVMPPLTVTFDGAAAEHAVVETEPEPEVPPEETALSEEETWSPPEESDEIPEAVDAEAAMGAADVAETPALLSDTETVETAETAKQTGDDEAALYPLSDTEVAEDAAEIPLLESEVLLEETAFSEEEETWLPSEESDEIPEAIDAEAAMGASGVAEAPALLSDTETVETAGHEDEAVSYPLSDAEMAEVAEDAAEIPLLEPVAGFWYLVEESEDSQKMESEAPEAAAETKENATEETGFSEAEPEALQEIEKAEAEEKTEEKTEEAGLTEPEPDLDLESEDEEIVMSSVAEEWADGMDDEFVEPEISETLEEALAEADKRPEMDVAAIEKTVSEAAPEMVAEIPASMKTASVSAAALLSERQPQGDETKTFSPRYSAAQLLTAYQHQNPQAQNIKAAPTAPPSSSDSTLALTEEHGSLLTIESARESVAVKQEKQVPPVKKESLELTLEPLRRDTWSEYPARSTGASPNEDDYYPILTDVVDEDELSKSNTA